MKRSRRRQILAYTVGTVTRQDVRDALTRPILDPQGRTFSTEHEHHEAHVLVPVQGSPLPPRP